MNIRKLIASILFIAVLLTATSAMADTVHIDKTLESMFLTLHLDADVENLSEGTQLTIYETDYPPFDTQSLTDMFLNGQANAQAEVSIDEKDFTIECDEWSTSYFAEDARFVIGYYKKYSLFWGYETVNQQATGLKTTPEEAINTAQELVDRLKSTLNWDGYTLNVCYTMPSEKDWLSNVATPEQQESRKGDPIETTGYYIVEYVKDIDGYTVAYDHSPYYMDRYVDTQGDHLQIYIDDNGIGYVTGYVRSYNAEKQESLQITLDDAIGILQENMDYVECYPNEMPCEITEIGLCYRLVQSLPASNEDAAVKMEARPVWRFAAGINRNSQATFYIFIDAVTGEVLS